MKCKPYSEITVEIRTQLKTVKITSNIFAVYDMIEVWMFCKYLLWKHEEWRLCDKSILRGALQKIIPSFPNFSYGQSWFVCLVQPDRTFQICWILPPLDICTNKYRGFSPYATFGTWKKFALAKNRISKIFILCTH